MPDPVVDGRPGNVEKGADLGYFVKGFVGQARGFKSGRGLLPLDVIHFFPDDLPDLLPVVPGIVGK